jgi:hypothetical protein
MYINRSFDMKKRDFRKISSLIIVLILTVSTSIFSQITDAEYKNKLNDSSMNADGTYSSKEFKADQRPEDSYLAKFKAIEVVEKLMKKNLDQIYLLKVIVSNNKGKGWDADYQKAYNGYRLAMELYYRRNVIYSRLWFENNKKFIDDMMKKISEEYKKQTEDMLFVCARKILELHLDEQTRSDPNKTEELFQNQMRLKISYGQFDDGQSSFLGHNYVSSILHYRVAKTYAIKILESLSKPDERDKLRDQYKVQKADNLNRIFDTGSAKRTAPSGGGGGTPQ